MSAQLKLVHAYTKAIAAKDFDKLQTLLHPQLAFTIYPRSQGIPTIEGADNFLAAAQSMLQRAHGINFEIIEDEVLEVPGRVWAAAHLSGKNSEQNTFSEELVIRARMAEYKGSLVLTEIKEMVDPKEEEIMQK